MDRIYLKKITFIFADWHQRERYLGKLADDTERGLDFLEEVVGLTGSYDLQIYSEVQLEEQSPDIIMIEDSSSDILHLLAAAAKEEGLEEVTVCTDFPSAEWIAQSICPEPKIISLDFHLGSAEVKRTQALYAALKANFSHSMVIGITHYEQNSAYSPVLFAMSQYRDIVLSKDETLKQLGTIMRAISRAYDLQKMTVLDDAAMMLRNQMPPHMLSNCLNQACELIKAGDRQEAETYITNLSNLLDFTIDMMAQKTIPLHQEIEFLELFIAIENTRNTTQNFTCRIKATPEVQYLEIPPMLVQPLLENAIKHGLRPQGKGNVTISFQRRENALYVLVEDDGVGFPEEETAPNGSLRTRPRLSISLQNIRQRIEKFNSYNDQRENRYRMEIDRTSGDSPRTRVQLYLPISTQKQ
ncbi:MAG: histidine kinase [Bacteroidota bacterium]